MINREYLKKIIFYNDETGIFTRNIAVRGYRLGSVCGSVNGRGYLLIQINDKRYSAHRLAWLYMTGSFPKNSIDHINGIKTDNRWCNLREATTAENIWNRPFTSNKKFVGVQPSGKKWKSAARINNIFHYIGSFKTEELAGAAYLEFIKKHRGEFYFQENRK